MSLIQRLSGALSPSQADLDKHRSGWASRTYLPKPLLASDTYDRIAHIPVVGRLVETAIAVPSSIIQSTAVYAGFVGVVAGIAASDRVGPAGWLASVGGGAVGALAGAVMGVLDAPDTAKKILSEGPAFRRAPVANRIDTGEGKDHLGKNNR